jgi:competence protein ComEA
MAHYSRQQLLLVLLLVGAAGAGLAIDHWRRASPEVVERLERLDRSERGAPEIEPRAARRPASERRRGLREAPRREPVGGEHAGRSSERPPHPSRREPVTPDSPLDVNHAGVPELVRLPGIGVTLATRIVEARPFATLEDLARVRGLRPGTLERLRPWLSVGSVTPPPSSAP